MFFTPLASRLETSLRHSGGGVGVLLLDVSVKMEILDFLLPRSKQKLLENIIIIPQKFVIEIDYLQPLLQFMRVKLGSCFSLGPFTLDTMTQSQGGGLESERNITGMFLWTKLINESSLTF